MKSMLLYGWLPLIFQPLCIKLTKTNNKKSSWRPSKVEQACSFIRFINVSFKFKYLQYGLK